MSDDLPRKSDSGEIFKFGTKDKTFRIAKYRKDVFCYPSNTGNSGPL